MDDILTRSACFQVTGFPDVDEAWLEEKAREIGEDLMASFGASLEWGQVVTLPTGNGIGIVLLLAPGCEQTPELAGTLMEIICQRTGIELPKTKRGKPKRKGGMPQFGLGPRFPAEFYASHGQIGR